MRLTMKDKPKRVLNVRIEEQLFLEVRAVAGGTDRTNAEVVTEALKSFFSRERFENTNPNQANTDG